MKFIDIGKYISVLHKTTFYFISSLCDEGLCPATGYPNRCKPVGTILHWSCEPVGDVTGSLAGADCWIASLHIHAPLCGPVITLIMEIGLHQLTYM